MSKRPSFQFYPQDWLGSPLIAAMTPAEEGGYIRLLCYCWTTEDCSLPDDDKLLARISRLDEGYLKGSSSLVKQCFIQHPTKPGYLTNKRLLDERKKQDDWKEKCKKGGKKSVESRTKKGEGYLKGSSTLVETKLQLTPNTSSSSSSSSSKSIIKNIIDKTPQTPLGGLDVVLPNFLPVDIFQNFLKHRRALKKPMTPHAQKLLISKLKGFYEKGYDIIAMLNESILRGWLSVFEPNQSQGRPHERQSTKSEQHWQYFEKTIQERASERFNDISENSLSPQISSSIPNANGD